jgi:hypothetical protein
MNHPIISSAYGNERYRCMLESAEKHRQSKVITRNRSKIKIIRTIRQLFEDHLSLDSRQPADTPV